MIVRQWAKLRWGVFDEHYDPEISSKDPTVDPYYVDSDNELHGTRCSELITGDVMDSNYLPCMQDQHTGSWDPSCTFVPHKEQDEQINESTMFASNIDSVCST